MKSGSDVSQADLARAFEGGDEGEKVEKTVKKKQKLSAPKKSHKLPIAIGIFVLGLITLVAGVVFLVLDLTSAPAISDGEYLMSAEEWSTINMTNCGEAAEATNCADGPTVIWKFTEVGKGTLTTNNHINDYDFIWAIENGKLKIETKWLYDLNDEFDYTINQNDKTLTLTRENEEIVFVGHFAENQ